MGHQAGSETVRWILHPDRALDAYLDAYLDGELDDRDTDRVAAHLGHCLLCRQRAAITRQILRSLRTMAGRS